MDDITIYHNPRCSKSRQTLALLEEAGYQPIVIKYLETPPSIGALQMLRDRLVVPVRGMMRTKESTYRAMGLDDEAVDDAQLFAAIAEQPILLERPIVVRGDRAVIGRPPENVKALL